MPRMSSVYPSGWFHIGWSADLRRGEVRPIRWFERDLVLFRGESGAARVLDAHCPHLGAHLGHGGKVIGDVLRCPFHGTCFDGRGEVTRAEPRLLAEFPKENLRTRAWALEEAGGMLFLRHGDAPAFPRLPELDGVSGAEAEPWVPFRRGTWKVRASFRDLVENSTDVMHFVTVHGFKSGAVRDVVIDGSSFRYTIELSVAVPLLGDLDTLSEVEYHGLGIILLRPKQARSRFRFLQTVTQLDREHITTTMTLYIQRRDWLRDLPMNLALWHYNCRSLAEDFRIFEHKKRVAHEPANDTDRAIAGWYAQFFSD